MFGNTVCKCDNMRDLPDDIYSFLESELGTDFLKYDDIQVDGNAASSHLPKDILDVARFIVNPQKDEPLGGYIDDTHVITGDDIRVNCSKFENLSSTDCCYGSHVHYETLNKKLSTEASKLDPNFEFSDGMFQQLEEDRSIYLNGGILNSSLVFSSDVGSSHKVTKSYYDPSEDSSLQKSCPVYHSQHLENGGMVKNSSLPKVDTSPPESTSDEDASFLENMTVDQLHEAFKRTFGRDTYINDKEWLKRRIMFGLESIKEIERDTNITESSFPLNEHGDTDNSVFLSNFDFLDRTYGSLNDVYGSENTLAEDHIGQGDHDENGGMTCLSNLNTVKVLNLDDTDGEIRSKKRLRKPTRRYIEELSENKSRTFTKKIVSQALSCDGVLQTTKDGSYNQESSIVSFVHSETPVDFSNPLPSVAGCRRGRPRKNSSLLVSKGNKELKPKSSSGPKGSEDFDPSESESPDDTSVSFSSKSTKSLGRRKHHRQWTLSEVIKLIDGVSHYGVGRWTEIKRIFFPSSVYRTSVDLKDKWRNLLRATGSHIHGKKVVERSKKHTCNQIPHSVTRRVRELSTMYPYPRGRKSRPPLVSDLPVVTTSVGETSVLQCNISAVHDGRNPSKDFKASDSLFAH